MSECLEKPEPKAPPNQNQTVNIIELFNNVFPSDSDYDELMGDLNELEAEMLLVPSHLGEPPRIEIITPKRQPPADRFEEMGRRILRRMRGGPYFLWHGRCAKGHWFMRIARGKRITGNNQGR